ncbi:MAG: sigma-70 family RNA polymerase sigma factor, partial [Bacteroidetes bacterium]|nr:sigma-70 family RNA polymerase sigma factor [Bacteroidota bacterium]
MPIGKALISSLNQGVHSAWKEVHDEYGNSLFGLAKAMTGSADDARDVVQETMINAYMKIYNKPYESVEEVVKYIFWKAKCHSLDKHRR